MLILVFSFTAGIISTAGGRVSMEELKFDSRGGVTTAELYTPRGVSSEDKLPAIMILPGGGCTYRVTSGIAQELARRGFVVLNVNINGAGNSENPPIDDMGLEPGVFYSTRGAKDALEYLRTLKYVDQTRIGLAGHSMGGLRTGGAASADASYYTLNDLLINKLTDEFGVELDFNEIIYSCINKKMSLKEQITYLGINIKFSKIMKSLLLSFIMIVCGYASLLIIKTAFNQHYRLWMSAFDVMSMARLCAWFRYSLLALPLFFVNACLVNIGKMKDMREGTNIVLCTLINVAGVLIAAIINYGYMYATNLGPITTFFCTQWSLLLMIPVTTIISRLLFNRTHSVWLGAFTNAMLIAWLWVSVSDTSIYTGASVVARYLGF